MRAEKKGNRRVQKKREQRGKTRSVFLSCLLVICMLVIFTDNAAKTVKATEVAAAEESALGNVAAEATGALVAPEESPEENTAAVEEAPGEGSVASSGGGAETAAETLVAAEESPEETTAAAEQAADADMKVMYLTFDDGPSAESTEQILDILKERNIKATFFVIGENVRKHPETARRIVEEGHTIGIHCDVHDYEMLYESVDSYVADFEKAYDTVLSVTGVEAKIFRFPGGSVNAYNKDVCCDIIAEMEARGFVYFDWNASVEDATGGKPTPEELVQNAVDTSLGRKRVILLAHDRVENTALALDALIDAFPEYQMEPLTAETAPVQF